MTLSKSSLLYLMEIGATDDASKRLVRSRAKDADELIKEGLAMLIHISTGGADICLTASGLAEYEARSQ